jgi:exodeoxyribonuclease-3
MKELTLLSWNVNGIRALAGKRGFLDWLARAQPDVVCLQETRAGPGQLPRELVEPAGYHAYWNAGERAGYSGTALLTRTAPRAVEFALGVDEFDHEGRTIVAHYADFTLINCYFPNGGRDHSRVPYKLRFYDAFLARCQALRAAGRRVLFCGDVNTAHREIDLARPKPNRKTTGFLPEECAWMDRLVQTGYVDTFRHFYPDLAGQYSWWSTVTGARARNVGWRLDYFFAAPECIARVKDAFILPEVTGSDHCPVGIRLRSR